MGVPIASAGDSGVYCMREQGITEVYGKEKERWYVKAPAFSFAKIRGMDFLPLARDEIDGRGDHEDDKLTRALSTRHCRLRACTFRTTERSS